MYNASNFTTILSKSSQLVITTAATSQGNYEHPSVFWLRVILICILIIIVVIGNLMVLYCLLTIKEMQTVTGLFLTNLAVTDLGVGLISLPLSLASSIEHNLLHKTLFCIIQGMSIIIFVITSLLTLGALSLQKYINIGYSMNKRFTKRIAKYFIGGIWTTSAIFAVAPASGWSTYTYSTGGHQCAPYAYSIPGYVYIVLLMVIGIIIPSVTMVYCYCKLYMMTRSHCNRVRNINEAANAHSTQHTLSSVESHMIHTLIIMMVAFFICWLPVLFIYILKGAKIQVSLVFEMIVVLCASGNSAVNPVLYAMRQKDFQRGFRQIFRRICGRPVDS